MVKLQPFGNRVTVRVINPEETTVGGLIVASVEKRNSNRGVVEAVGDGEDVKGINVSDTVLFNTGAGVGYTDLDEDYRVISINDILGKVIG